MLSNFLTLFKRIPSFMPVFGGVFLEVRAGRVWLFIIFIFLIDRECLFQKESLNRFTPWIMIFSSKLKK